LLEINLMKFPFDKFSKPVITRVRNNPTPDSQEEIAHLETTTNSPANEGFLSIDFLLSKEDLLLSFLSNKAESICVFSFIGNC